MEMLADILLVIAGLSAIILAVTLACMVCTTIILWAYALMLEITTPKRRRRY